MRLSTGCAGCTGHRRAGFREAELPACVRGALEAARAARPDRDLVCLSYRTHSGGQQIVTIGADMPCTRDPLQPKDVIVLSVTATETTFDEVESVTHVLVARMQPRTGE